MLVGMWRAGESPATVEQRSVAERLDALELCEAFEHEGGQCPECSRGVELWTCSECGTSAWQIDCTHRQGPSWLRRGRSDGTWRTRVFCAECADVLQVEALPA
jgi:hypothetical protein